MDLYLRLIPCCLLCLLTGAESPAIVYPFVSTCAVVGSTVTLPCTFTPRPSFNDDNGRTVPLRVVRVLWCRNHEICQFPTPSVYSSNDRRPSRFHYLGDKQRNCTLQIRKIQTNESATYRFRMEADDSRGHFTNRTGVEVRVTGSAWAVASIMASSRTCDDARAAFQTTRTSDPRQLVRRYDSWAENYETDQGLMDYQAPMLAVDSLTQHFSGDPAQALVLDVACGSGWVAKLMSELGFRHFVGVDGSQGMLDMAAKTGLYRDLRLVLLGPEPLADQAGAFDVVTIVGALDAGFCPVSIVRELCSAAKPGGLICMARGDHTGAPAAEYSSRLERELQLMEAEGLWRPLEVRRVPKYMTNPHVHPQAQGEEPHITGTVFVYEKST